MKQVTSPSGATISYEVLGSGPPLVLIHGSLTNHNSNWFAVKGSLAERFTVYAIDRRGRGETSTTAGHSIEEEFEDVAAVIRNTGEPVSLLGHSYGAHVALGAAALVPDLVRKLILYEPPVATSMTDDQLRALEGDAAEGNWDAFVSRFLGEVTHMPSSQLATLRTTPIWQMLLAEGKATLQDFHALKKHDFKPEKFASLTIPILFLCGSLSPPVGTQVTDSLMNVIPDATKATLGGQGHEGMLTNSSQFVDTVSSFLLS